MTTFDGLGWAEGKVDPIEPRFAHNLLSPEPSARVDLARWAHHARVFFRADLSLAIDKRYPSGTEPIADVIDLRVVPHGHEPSTVRVITVPIDRAPLVVEVARRGAAAIGGAGFDALIPRARRAWQVVVDDTRTIPELLVAAVLASVLLAPVVPSDGGRIFGVKGCRERLSAAGYRS